MLEEGVPAPPLFFHQFEYRLIALHLPGALVCSDGAVELQVSSIVPAVHTAAINNQQEDIHSSEQRNQLDRVEE